MTSKGSYMRIPHLLLCTVLSMFIMGSAYSLESLRDNKKIVIGNNLNVRESYDRNSKVIYQLKITSIVKILKVSNKKEKIGNMIGNWVLIDTLSSSNSTKSIKGWVFDAYLADLKDFKKVNSFYNISIEKDIGDWLLSYKFKRNGEYLRKSYIHHMHKYVTQKGRLYKYKGHSRMLGNMYKK